MYQSGISTILILFLQRKFATPLLLAASGGHKVVVEVLIAHGASASDEDAVSIRAPALLHRLIVMMDKQLVNNVLLIS